MKKLNKGIVLFLLGAILVGAVPTNVLASDNLIYSYHENNQDISLSKDLTNEQDFIEEIFRVIETTPQIIN